MSSDKEPANPYKQLDPYSQSTKNNHDTSSKHWDYFAEKASVPKFSDLTQENVCGEVLSNGSLVNEHNPPIKDKMWKFANYLYEYRKQDGKGDPLAPKVVMQYFTSIKSMLFTKFKPLGYTGNSPKWYNDVYKCLDLKVKVACIARGGTISKKAVGMPREVLGYCCEALMKQDNFSISSEKRSILVALFHAVGRGVEVSTANWNSSYWNAQLQLFTLQWGEGKTGDQIELTFSNDANSWLLDYHHSLACNLIGGSGSHKASSSDGVGGWMHNAVVDMAEGGAANYVSRVLDECRSLGVEGIPDDTTCHGIRVTGTDEMMFNPALSIWAAIARGGWHCEADTLAFHYFTKKKHVVAAGLALAGYANPNIRPQAPTLLAIGTDLVTVSQVNAFSGELFNNVGVPDLATRLRDYRDVLVATLLMYHEQVVALLGNKHPLVNTMNLAAIHAGITIDIMAEWGKKVRERFIVQNAANIGAYGESEEERLRTALSQVTEICIKTQDTLSVMTAKVTELDEKATRIEAGVNTLLALQHPGAMSPCRPHKKQRLASESDGVSTVAAVAAAKPDVYTTMKTGQTLLTHSNIFKVKDMSTNKFVELTIKARQPPSSSIFGGTDIDSSSRKRFRDVFTELKALADGNEKYYFDHNKAPIWDHHHSQEGMPDRDVWFQQLDRVVTRLTNTLLDTYLKKKARLQNLNGSEEAIQQAFTKLKRGQKKAMGSLGNLIETVKSAEKRGKWDKNK